ncbi:hypothetical protein E1B28_002344 [Marasmius oreades]|uniref:Uncharacterized protein n=1 Tax=Marasmius oreades TaxID=181124 RepID=A0A9P7UKI2_9AGAR|nr:uncharacterized protein E1B28_002344 [Marasmius oreades]KAG7086387.1 hypothetical protein E1B28_002344 [Marasmius oreades]
MERRKTQLKRDTTLPNAMQRVWVSAVSPTYSSTRKVSARRLMSKMVFFSAFLSVMLSVLSRLPALPIFFVTFKQARSLMNMHCSSLVVCGFVVILTGTEMRGILYIPSEPYHRKPILSYLIVTLRAWATSLPSFLIANQLPTSSKIKPFFQSH